MNLWRDLALVHSVASETIEGRLHAECGLSYGWFAVLEELGNSPGGRMRNHELAERLLHSRSGLSRRLESMEKAGLVDRERSDDDRRGVFAVMTAEGREMLRKSAPVVHEEVERVFLAALGTEDVYALGKAFGKVLGSSGRSSVRSAF